MHRRLPDDATFVLPDPTVPEAAALARMIGRDAAFALIEGDGGARIFIPRGVNQGSVLARKIGLDAARILAGEFGGTMLAVPLAKPWLARVYRDRDGSSYSAIARKLKASETSVAEWLALYAPPSRHGQPAAPVIPKKAP